jgi:5-methylcytosine-specific restriction endonuclease McrA
VPQEVITKLKEIKYGLDITILDNKEYWMWREKRIQENNSARNSFEYKLWHKKVLERDNYTCQICGRKMHHLHVHHIKPFALYPELRIDIENGIALCNFCHKNVHKGEI